MSVLGIGNDIVEIQRISEMAEAVQERLAKRVLTPREYQRYASLSFKAPYLAKRWAGKEAAAKALGVGIADGVSFQHFDIVSLESGQPTLELTGRAQELAQQMGARHIHISLSDEKHYALAFVVLSR
ncbi:holo-ACP synthase [Thalassotalea ponticola]|uniref:holo-ACP synthase n=1 Tax=Thalassotalea ponticola TaxID=1523392 RepID=UPI0025B44311|nr:holo-ACP synthase [Thalassotalea ponticola]MDN3652122.1 holo-ACP synthase [Thalassotalea ponticola]